MTQVFISYKSTPKERVFADRLRDALKEQGIEAWVDHESIEAGEQWKNTLEDKLHQAAAVVFLIGPDGQVSEQQREEASVVFRTEWGRQRKTPLIPVVTGNPELPPFLKQVAAIKVEDVREGWSGAAQKIKLSLSGSAPEVASVPAPSGESEQKARLLEIQQFADSLKASSESSAGEKFAR
jgi:hypothetical protein